MIRIPNLSLAPEGTIDDLRRQTAIALCIAPSQIKELTISRQSIDARNRGNVHYVCTVDVTVDDEATVLKKASIKNATLFAPVPYVFPVVARRSAHPPVVVGMGPAGLFTALYLARNGIKSIVLERGQDVDTRAKDVTRFWKTGKINPNSNVQFGEGGAGTFSDGKLTTGTHDPRISSVTQTLVDAGAPADVAYSHKPHIGTDVLRQIVKTLREELISLGCEVRFGHQLVSLTHNGDTLTEIGVSSTAGNYTLPCDSLILAPGHSARDTFQMLHDSGVPMEQKNFAIGVRIEHKQSTLSEAQYGPSYTKLPPADYKLACHLPSGRSAFTFCICPGGQVVGASSSEGELVTNGMSNRARDGENINGGFLVNVGPSDFESNHPLAGVEFQRKWEQLAFKVGGNNFSAPAQRVEDFLARRPSTQAGTIAPTYLPAVAWGSMDDVLPDFVVETMREAFPVFNRKVRGFAAPDAVMTGVETRSSSPVRIPRDETLQSTIRGIYPCGEGAGYSGGIVSAAVDGIRVAEAVAQKG